MAPTPNSLSPRPGDALIVVDVQNDFLPGGALGVPVGDEVVPVLNEYLERFDRRGLPVFAARDWHPRGHCSFRSAGGPWPLHCVADTHGAAFASGLALPAGARIISKATDIDHDAYSAFAGTDLAERLRGKGVRRLFVGGLATDYCVLGTVKDAIALGFEMVLLCDAVRAVNVRCNDGDAAIAEMKRLGAVEGRLAAAGSL
jgi:nicotinamidase/pyrazinamidase